MNDQIAAIRSCDWLYLNEIGEPNDNELRIVLGEAVSGQAYSQAKIAEEQLPELRQILENARPIIHGKGCRIFELIWPSYIAYSVRNESFTTVDEEEVGDGRLFVEYAASKYLDFVNAATFADASYPGPFKHWGLNCLNHIIDVVSIDAPIIQVTIHP